MDYDKILCNIFFNDNRKLSNNYWKLIRRDNKNVKDYLINRYDDLEGGKTIYKESLYRILNNIEYRCKCKVCGKYTKFNPLKNSCYNDHCSYKCEMNNKLIREQQKLTCIYKYGSSNNIQKHKQTCIKKYGVDNAAKSDIIKEKQKNTNMLKYGYSSPLQNKIIKIKTKYTNIKKYNNEIPQHNIKVKEKIKKSNIETCKYKYNVDNIMQLKDIINKVQHTKRKNNTFNTSKSENESYKLLKEKFPDVIKQYYSDLYPFNCDFYIPSLDLYIECNYHWTHGGKPYENTKEDNLILEKWKSKNTKFYDNAIKCWTERDVNKRNKAKENNLNYVEFWDVEGLKCWLKSI